MRIREIVTEEISLTRHYDYFHNAAKNAILKSLSSAANHAKTHENFTLNSAKSETNSTKSLTPMVSVMKDLLSSQLTRNLSDDFTKSANKVIPANDEISVYFVEMHRKVDGFARGWAAFLDKEQYCKELANSILEKTRDSYLDNVGSETKMSEKFLAFIVKLTEQSSEYNSVFSSEIMQNSKIERIVDKMVGTLIHELVHLSQNIPQLTKGRKDTEYRSYLNAKGKKHEEFQGKEGVTNFNLYLASPQEISAFAHNISMNIIQDFGLRHARNVDEIENIESSTIVGYVDDYLQNRFKQPSTPKERAVYKRYLKLVYLELSRYVAALKERLKKKEIQYPT